MTKNASNKSLHNGTVKDLQGWIEKRFGPQYPGIEYWAWHKGRNSKETRPSDRLEEFGPVHHVACYAHRGQGEGTIVEIAVEFRSIGIKRLGFVKSFDSHAACWAMAQGVSDALESILLYRETPGTDQEAASEMLSQDRLAEKYHTTTKPDDRLRFDGIHHVVGLNIDRGQQLSGRYIWFVCDHPGNDGRVLRGRNLAYQLESLRDVRKAAIEEAAKVMPLERAKREVAQVIGAGGVVWDR